MVFITMFTPRVIVVYTTFTDSDAKAFYPIAIVSVYSTAAIFTFFSSVAIITSYREFSIIIVVSTNRTNRTYIRYINNFIFVFQSFVMNVVRSPLKLASLYIFSGVSMTTLPDS